MGRREGCLLTLVALLSGCAVALPACGGDDSSSHGTTTPTVAGASGATAATGSTGSTGASGSKGSGSGGAAVPGSGVNRPSGSGAAGSNGTAGSKDNNNGGSNSKRGSGQKESKKTNPTFGTTNAQKKELYREAKRICGILSLPALAKEYQVASTPEAVARAYARAYPDQTRDSAYRGCKAGVS